MTKSTPFFADFLGWRCQILTARYASGKLALLLVDADDDQPVATATVSLDVQPRHDCVLIKTWSENAGIDEALITAGVLEPGVIARHPTGFAEALEYRLTTEFMKTLAVQKILSD